MSGRPVRVAQLVTTLARGGAQATVLAALDMDAHGVAVTVLAGPDDTGEGTHWPELGERAVVVPDLHRPIDPVADARVVRWLAGWLAAERPDVLHTHSSKAGVVGRVAARLVGVPVVHTVHGWSFAPHTGQTASANANATSAGGPAGRDDPVVDRGPGRRERRDVGRRGVIELERRLAAWTRALVVVTPLDAATGLAAGIGHPDSYHVIRSGIDLTVPRAGLADRGAIRSALGLDDRFVVGTVGRLADQKDPLTLLTGFAAMSDPADRLVIVGDGPLRREVEAAAGALGIADRVVLTGQRPDAARLVAAFDVFALTSRWEGLPRAVVEATAAGVAVVATPVGGVPELIRDGETGLLVPVSAPDALAGALRRLRDDRVTRRRLASAAGAGIERFSVTTMRRDLRALWRETAGAGPLVVGAALP